MKWGRGVSAFIYFFSLQGNAQSIQLVSSLQRPCRSSTNQVQGSKNIQAIASRGIINAQKSSLKTAGNSQISGSVTTTGLGNQVLTLTAQQQVSASETTAAYVIHFSISPKYFLFCLVTTCASKASPNSAML